MYQLATDQLVTLTIQVFCPANTPRYWNKIEASCPTLQGAVLHSRTTINGSQQGRGVVIEETS